MCWGKYVLSNLFRIAGIPVDRSSFVSGIDLIVKTHKKKICKLSLFSGTAYLLHHNPCFVPTNMALKRYLACRTFSKCQSYRNKRCLSKRTYTLKSMLTTSCTNASVERAVYQDGGITNILTKSLRRRTAELQFLWLLCIVMWKWITRNQYMTSCAENIVNCSILKWLLSKCDAWLIFCSDNATTIFEASWRAFQYEKLLIKI